MLRRLEEEGYDSDLLMKKIHDIVIKTLITIQPKLLHTYNVLQPRSKNHDMCFELLGFDILLEKTQPKNQPKDYMLGKESGLLENLPFFFAFFAKKER